MIPTTTKDFGGRPDYSYSTDRDSSFSLHHECISNEELRGRVMQLGEGVTSRHRGILGGIAPPQIAVKMTTNGTRLTPVNVPSTPQMPRRIREFVGREPSGINCQIEHLDSFFLSPSLPLSLFFSSLRPILLLSSISFVLELRAVIHLQGSKRLEQWISFDICIKTSGNAKK